MRHLEAGEESPLGSMHARAWAKSRASAAPLDCGRLNAAASRCPVLDELIAPVPGTRKLIALRRCGPPTEDEDLGGCFADERADLDALAVR